MAIAEGRKILDLEATASRFRLWKKA